MTIKSIHIINYSNFLLIFAFILNFGECKAQSHGVDDQMKSTIEVRADLSQKLSESKLELEKVYKKSIMFLDSVGTPDAENYKSFLVNSQDGWKKYAGGKCKIIAYQSREAAHGVDAFYRLCMTELNNERTAELKRMLNEWKLEFNK